MPNGVGSAVWSNGEKYKGKVGDPGRSAKHAGRLALFGQKLHAAST